MKESTVVGVVITVMGRWDEVPTQLGRAYLMGLPSYYGLPFIRYLFATSPESLILHPPSSNFYHPPFVDGVRHVDLFATSFPFLAP